MAFWVDWELWEKLSVILAMLIALVLLYAFCVLGWNRWMISKYAATEAKEREAEAEVYPMLHKDDIPFGARALERGVEVEGIWVSDPNTPTQSPCQPATPVPSRPTSPAPKSLHREVDNPKSSAGSQSPMINPKPMPPAARREVVSDIDIASAGFVYENHRSAGRHSRASLPIDPSAMRISPAREESLIGLRETPGREKRVSFHTQISNIPPIQTRRTTDESFSGPSSEGKRSSRSMKLLRRRSSEEFRRRMSQIFNDNVQIGPPAEELEFNPDLHQYQGRFRKSLLRPFRPWTNPPENQQ
ncbi:hypothetical protein N7516_008348 [Penicillium verrucosum]|uniref:uncharacterized protein n=1 Tax=Penicillium verrucosum TaxID=60171 RepID=UPI0025457A7E|nr:uncharacterized protein N7516_008348 [Penicillium verrucosum]KAJ5926575.1 hypothetical protein N7516_008348 [Penicillium verrucosum]